MKNKTILIIIFSLSLVEAYAQRQRNVEGATIYVSMVKILASPESFNNKKVMVTGFIHSKFEDSAIYFSKEQADYLNTSNAFWVSYDSVAIKKIIPKDFDQKYVTVVGTFYSDQYGHMGGFAGTIKVESIQKSRRWYKSKN